MPFQSPLPSIEPYEKQCLHNFFNENGKTSLFGLLIDKDGIIEYAIGSHIEDLLGLPIHHLLHRPFILLVSLQDRARICSLLPSSNSYRYGSTKRLQLDFVCDKNSSKVSRLEVSTKLICIPSGMNSSQTEKTLVACVARRPSDDVPSGTFSLFLDRVNFRVVGYDGRNANLPFLTDTTFHGKTLQELCKRQEWPTIDLILETACHVQRSSTELTFSLVDGINLVTTVMTLSSKGSTGPIQLQCQIQRSFGTAGVTRSVSISDPGGPSPSNGVDLNANQMDKTAIPPISRTISVPAQAHFFGPNSNSTVGSCPDDRMDFVINSVVSNSESKPDSSMLRNLLNQGPQQSQYAPYTPTPTPKSSAGTVQNPPPSPFGYGGSMLPVQIADMKIENSDMPGTSEMPMPTLAKEPAKKKRVRNPAQKGPKLTKKQRELEKQAAEAAAIPQPHSQEMFQTAGYPAPPPGGYPGPPPGNPNAANAAMMMRGNGGPPQGMRPPHSQGQPQGQGGFNPNMPSSSRANPMTSTATAGYMQMNHPHGMGPPMGGPMGHPGYNHMAQMQQQQQQQQQQGGPMGGPSQMQHGPGPNMGMPNQWQGMYQGPHPGQQMYGPQGGYPGQQRPGFMPPHGMQAPPQQQQQQAPAPAKKPSKRKSNQQKHQEAVAAMQANTSNAAPPPKQAFLNPMGGPPVGFNGNSNFPGGAQPNQMGNHLSPYHPHSQHAQQAQLQAMNDWNRQQAMAAANANRAGSTNTRNEPAIRGDVRSKLHASIHSRQNASPQQMAAMMSPNDLAAAASGRYPPGSTGANAGNSISPPTMMSPPRINQVPQNPGHAASNYGPQSVPNPPSMPSEQNHHVQQQQGQGQQGHPMFSPKMQPPQGFYHQNGHSQMNNGFMGASGQGGHNGVVPGMTHLQNQNELPQVTLEDCKAILQETDFADFDSISFDMTNKQGFDFNYDESRTLLQRILS